MRLIALIVGLLTAPTAAAQRPPTDVFEGQVIIEYILVDPPESESLLRRAQAASPPYEWISGWDYPQEALSERRTGTVKIKLRIGVDNRILDCSVIEPATDPRLTAVPCPLIKRRGAFRHALGTDGTPREGSIGFELSFSIVPVESQIKVITSPPPLPGGRFPKRRAEPVDPRQLVIHDAPPAEFPRRSALAMVDIDEKGIVTRCAIIGSSGTDPGDVRACRHIATVRFTPRVDPEGKPEPSLYTPVSVRIDP